ncbi:nitroreductase [Bradyrhizobium sp. U87765 SZCCT0131]|uniref:nitroreductase n=1 Tax=unclassified Bradyrhizobium TaxID=2631580 RepID=UPI001BAB8EA8|nr:MULTISPECIES: nitroreductase [unclassified Bradyrhizobium]MBR1217594.1 nitroreductase [Bradyrhizobium sp. U87765 SZCCT0131]MBR1264808.1 nitroreductase [Bradyrhizobium sp. U87765 SZCCT0134]MBR1304790.1 nitroreductase [Bradyrhizobium sp. U87765 SZCCT0110]MBR1320577.1 nitroreductase [Bradyrhizobium sp. U87765 SZCCT0109]MBR1348997.1 nitroreductase [Bradyrhizobium sp. U87765 SZCCT0048]
MTTSSAGRIEVIEALLAERYSCRAFRSDPVPRATIERILAAAQRTASWCNSQPWQVIVASGAAARRFSDAIYAAADAATTAHDVHSDFPFPREYRGVYLDRRRESGFQLYNALGIARGDKEGYRRQSLQNFKLFGAPHVAIISSDEALGVYGAVDCGGYVSNFMLAAQALGVATIPQAALAGQSDLVRHHFGLGDDRRVVCGISFGFADGEHAANSYRTNRANLQDAATFVET